MKIFYKKAFTLVELIIVITILVILSTIAFLNFGNYGAEARDAVRKADLENIKKALELYKIENGEYISPGNSKKSEDFEGWTDGFITEEIGGKLRFGKVPVDPLGDKAENKYYKYSVSDDGDAYRLEVDYELEGKLVLGNISSSCQDIFTNNQFRGNGVYKAYSSNYKPINIYCHQDYKNNTFFDEIVGGDMEIDKGIIGDSKGGKIIYSEEDAVSGNKSIKIFKGHNTFTSNHYTYVDQNKNYSLSANIKVLRKDNNQAGYHIGFLYYDKDFREIRGRNVNVFKEYTIKNGNLIIGENPLKETELTRPVTKNSKEIYFRCDDKIYNSLKDYLKKWDGSRSVLVAFEVDDSGNYKDLPNFKLSEETGSLNKGQRTLGDVEKNGNECKLFSLKTNFKANHNYGVGTKIRFHYAAGGRLGSKRFFDYENWQEKAYQISGFSPYGSEEGKFRKGTVFVKPDFWVNIYSHYRPNGVWTDENLTSITYIDDIKLEITN